MVLKKLKRKDCRKYLRMEYEFPFPIENQTLNRLSVFGEPEIVPFSQFNPVSNDFFKIRNYEFALEITGTLNDHQLSVTFSKKEAEIVSYIESELKSLAS